MTPGRGVELKARMRRALWTARTGPTRPSQRRLLRSGWRRRCRLRGMWAAWESPTECNLSTCCDSSVLVLPSLSMICARVCKLCGREINHMSGGLRVCSPACRQITVEPSQTRFWPCIESQKHCTSFSLLFNLQSSSSFGLGKEPVTKAVHMTAALIAASMLGNSNLNPACCVRSGSTRCPSSTTVEPSPSNTWPPGKPALSRQAGPMNADLRGAEPHTQP